MSKKLLILPMVFATLGLTACGNAKSVDTNEKIQNVVVETTTESDIFSIEDGEVISRPPSETLKVQKGEKVNFSKLIKGIYGDNASISNLKCLSGDAEVKGNNIVCNSESKVSMDINVNSRTFTKTYILQIGE